MCGINGFNFENAKLISEMNKAIRHRGPDDSGFKTFKNASIANVRLSIIDLSKAGHQPMTNEDGSLHIVYNGELYNYKELKKTLKKKHKFKSNTYTEVILHLYEEKGVKMLDDLNGMFAFCIYDSKKEQFFLARDRAGMKPLYYYNKDGKFIFSSEIKAILKHDIDRKANNSSIVEYMTFQNIIDDKTFFQDINQLQPGKYMIVKDGKTEIKKYWDVQFKYRKKSNKNILKEFLKIFSESIKRHMISDVEVGCCLSGGFDSTSVATMSSMLYEKKLKTFTGYYKKGPEYDERKFSRAVIKNIGAEPYEIEITPKKILNNINRIIYHLDEPRVGMVPISQYFVSELAAKKVKVVLTGHGGDELFAGYPIIKAYYFKEKIKRNPLFIFKAMKNFRSSEVPFMLQALAGPLMKKEMRNGMTIVLFTQKERNKLFTKKFLKESNFNPESTVKKELYGKRMNTFEKVQYFYLRSYLPSLFNIEDKISMAFSLEGRIPFCDKELIRLALDTPMEKKLKDNIPKYIIKESMRNYLPKKLYHQKKKGFPTPLEHLFRKELKTYIYSVLTSKRFDDRGIFRKDYIKELLDKHMSGKNYAIHIWAILCTELWFRTFIDPAKVTCLER